VKDICICEMIARCVKKVHRAHLAEIILEQNYFSERFLVGSKKLDLNKIHNRQFT